MKKVSIKDIAKEAGVSFSTVSIVLNGQGKERKISDKMITEIFKVADQLNYRPNQFAKSLRTGKTFTLGLIVDDISNYFFGHLAKFVEEEADKFGYTVMFCNSENNEGKARNVLGTLLDKQMDGYIIAPTSGMVNEIENLVREKKPIVLIDRYFQNVPSSYVTIDNYKGAYDSVDYLIRQGYQKIALVTNETDQIQILDRVEGYKAALRKHKISFLPELVKKISFKNTEQKTIKELETFIKAQPAIDAILFTSNNLGIPGLQSLRNLNIKIATDIGVICFDDHDLFRLAFPGITVVSQPIKTISKKVVKLLLDQIDGNVSKDHQIVLPPNLIIRDSTPLRS
ncbi:LacI family transcriptional regulator [Chitinophagaceae bacterium LB-8]|uniref:LacI family transcriptional regulator n=1 Tax=Paraflavisolibacter caeni TaxID=2982496 RepID=A0A9X2XXA8_9BACT|nr:LacI family DNA-binding transcriptional regulator [Paraflavisolibacter caeni]MCU7549438.1 LacI family transcriptional regulator [Paraflavisolibacter caeni]